MSTKILFVDDDPKLLAAVSRSLRLRFNLATATSGESALAKMAAEGPFGVIVADMQMPGMNGIQLLDEVQKRHPETVRLMLTGNADQTTAIEAVTSDRDRLISRPTMTGSVPSRWVSHDARRVTCWSSSP